jgi:hypothetical protein
MASDSATNEYIHALEDKVAALRTLVSRELDIDKLTFYTRELERVSGQLRAVQESGLERRQSARVLPFAPKKPRSA